VPNLLCVTRMLAAPYISILVVNGDYKLACVLFICAGATDVIDGYIARRYPSQASALGSVLDPLADKCLVAALYGSLTFVELIPLPLTLLVVARDAALILYTMNKRYETLAEPKTWRRYWDPNTSTIVVRPTMISKANTGVQLTLAAATVTAAALDMSNIALLPLLWYTTTATTILSGFSYVFAAKTFEYVKKSDSK